MTAQPALPRCHAKIHASRFGLAVAMALVAACADELDAADGSSSVVAPPAQIRDGTWDEGLAVGQTVALEGTFLGNDPESLCEFASTTRSRPRSGLDWAVRKDRRCMWVAGGERIFGNPQEILDRASVGRDVEIATIVRADDTGRFYLELVDGKAD